MYIHKDNNDTLKFFLRLHMSFVYKRSCNNIPLQIICRNYLQTLRKSLYMFMQFHATVILENLGNQYIGDMTNIFFSLQKENICDILIIISTCYSVHLGSLELESCSPEFSNTFNGFSFLTTT